MFLNIKIGLHAASLQRNATLNSRDRCACMNGSKGSGVTLLLTYPFIEIDINKQALRAKRTALRLRYALSMTVTAA